MLADNSLSYVINGKFSQIHSLFDGQKSELYEELDRYLIVPNEISLMNMSVRERKTTPRDTELTLEWSQTSPAYSPLDSEKAQNGKSVSEQFLQDLHRANYIIEPPDLEGNRIKANIKMTNEYKIGHLKSIFGEENTAVISEIAHQGHMAEFSVVGLAMCNNDHIIAQGDAIPQIIIKKQEDGNCRITSSLTFCIKNTVTGKIADGISLEMKRTSLLVRDPTNKTILRSGTKEEKDGMIFRIKYVKSDLSEAES
jgi:hypothetical protein